MRRSPLTSWLSPNLILHSFGWLGFGSQWLQSAPRLARAFDQDGACLFGWDEAGPQDIHQHSMIVSSLVEMSNAV